MKAALRGVRLIQGAMLCSVLLFVILGERLPKHFTTQNPMVYHAFSFVSISVLGAVFVIRRTLVTPSETQLVERPGDRIALERWKSGYVTIYALCETLAVQALVLRLLGFGYRDVWQFYLGSFALLLLFSPRTPQSEAVN